MNAKRRSNKGIQPPRPYDTEVPLADIGVFLEKIDRLEASLHKLRKNEKRNV